MHVQSKMLKMKHARAKLLIFIENMRICNVLVAIGIVVA